MSTALPVLSDLSAKDQAEINRINALTSAQRNDEETNFLAARAEYLTNTIIELDANGDILRCSGQTVPANTTSGFAKGCVFIKTNATTGVKSIYENQGTNTSCLFDLMGQPDNGTPVNAVAATGTLTSDNTNVADGATVTIGSQVYTFKTALTDGSTHPNEVLIGADADGSLTNLRSAINGTGTPGTDYDSSTPVNSDVTCGAVTSHAVVLTAKTKGTAANAKATTETSTHLSFGAATLSGGVDGTVGAAFDMLVDTSYLYICIAANTVADTNWRRISLGSAF